MEYVFTISALLIMVFVVQRLYEVKKGALTSFSRLLRSCDGVVATSIATYQHKYSDSKKIAWHFVSSVVVPGIYRFLHNTLVDMEFFFSYLRRRIFHRIEEKKRPVSLYLKSLEDHKNEIHKNDLPEGMK